MATKAIEQSDSRSEGCTITDVDAMIRAGLVKDVTDKIFALFATVEGDALPWVYTKSDEVMALQECLARSEKLSVEQYQVLIDFVRNPSVIATYKRVIPILVRMNKIIPCVNGVEHAAYENGKPSLNPVERRLLQLQQEARGHQ